MGVDKCIRNHTIFVQKQDQSYFKAKFATDRGAWKARLICSYNKSAMLTILNLALLYLQYCTENSTLLALLQREYLVASSRLI